MKFPTRNPTPFVFCSHVVRRRAGRADWAVIEKLYDARLALIWSPVVAINRAVAVAELRGPAAGLEALDALSGDALLAGYQSRIGLRAPGCLRPAAHARRGG